MPDEIKKQNDKRMANDRSAFGRISEIFEDDNEMNRACSKLFGERTESYSPSLAADELAAYLSGEENMPFEEISILSSRQLIQAKERFYKALDEHPVKGDGRHEVSRESVLASIKWRLGYLMKAHQNSLDAILLNISGLENAPDEINAPDYTTAQEMAYSFAADHCAGLVENQKKAFEEILGGAGKEKGLHEINGDEPFDGEDIAKAIDTEYNDALERVLGMSNEEIRKKLDEISSRIKASKEEAQRLAEEKEYRDRKTEEENRKKAAEEEERTRERLKRESELIVKAREEARQEAKAFIAKALKIGWVVSGNILEGLCYANKAFAEDKSPEARRFCRHFNGFEQGRAGVENGLSLRDNWERREYVSNSQLQLLYNDLSSMTGKNVRKLQEAVGKEIEALKQKDREQLNKKQHEMNKGVKKPVTM